MEAPSKGFLLVEFAKTLLASGVWWLTWGRLSSSTC